MEEWFYNYMQHTGDLIESVININKYINKQVYIF